MALLLLLKLEETLAVMLKWFLIVATIKLLFVTEMTQTQTMEPLLLATVSGTSISFGTPVVFESTRTESIAPTFDSTNNKVVICFRDDTGQDGYGIVGTVSGTSISFGSRSSAFNSGYFAYAAFEIA